MSIYTAPLKDMQFAIAAFAGLESISSLPGHDEVNAELIEAVLTEAGKFAQGVLDPLNRVGDRQGAQWRDGIVSAPPGFASAYRQFTEGGWNGLGAAIDFGGQGLPHSISMPLQEMWNSANMAFCLCPMLTTGVQEALMHHASKALLDTYLPKLVSGEWTGTMNLTEPQAGSDLSAVRASAIPEGDHYRIKGTKIFITWGEHDMAENIVHLLLARLPDAPEGVKGISLFVVPKYLVHADGTCGERNDIRCVSIESKLGIHGSPTCVLAYGDGPGAIGYLVGKPNRGLEYMFTMMNHARLGVGMSGIALAERAYQHALDYAKTRVQGRMSGKKSGDRVTIIHHPDVRRMLLSMRARIDAMRGIGYMAAGELDRAKHHPDAAVRAGHQSQLDLLTPVVKAWNTEMAVDIASLGIQIHGGMGFIEETGAAQYLRDARITTIYEGTTGIQANDLAGRKVGLEDGVSALALMTEMRLTGTMLGVAGGSALPLEAALTAAIDQLEAATRWVVAQYRKRPEAVAAVAVPYLKLFGCVTGGWVMARTWLIAGERLREAAADSKFWNGKQVCAQFYLLHLLPEAAALATTVCNGADSVLATFPEWQ
jgi:alkylation response protein AidB-like acyl-CoA dehydrogenase